jgi:hypothetical protein
MIFNRIAGKFIAADSLLKTVVIRTVPSQTCRAPPAVIKHFNPVYDIHSGLISIFPIGCEQLFKDSIDFKNFPVYNQRIGRNSHFLSGR